jgi:hypothetical protein
MNPGKRESLIIIVNSTAYYLLSYLAVSMIFQFTTLITAQIFDIPTTLFYNRMGFNVRPEVWTFDSVKVIFSAGNIMLFLISVLFLVINLKAMEFNGYLRMFFIWGFVHAISMLIGSVVMGSFNFDGFGIVMAYLYLSDTAKMILLFLGLVLMLGIGMTMIKPFLFTANIYHSFLSPEMSPKFRRNQFILPYLFSTLILFLIKYPLSLYDTLLISAPGFILIPLFWGVRHLPVFYFEEKENAVVLRYRIILLTAFLYAVYRVWFGIGLNIG